MLRQRIYFVDLDRCFSPRCGMDDPLKKAKEKAAATYDAAADHFDDEPLSFWDLIGKRTVTNLKLQAGAKVLAAGLENVEFRLADMTALKYPDDSFDAVVSVFSIFFVPDMEGLVRELWRMVRPGGKLAVTTWGPRIFEPGLFSLAHRSGQGTSRSRDCI